MMRYSFMTGALASFAFTSILAASPLVNPFNLNNASGGGHQSLFHSPTPIGVPAGETFSLAIMAQDGVNAWYLNDHGGPDLFSVQNFGVTESGGDNTVGTAGGTFLVQSASTMLGNGNLLVQVEVTAIGAFGFNEPWIAAGTLSPNDIPFTSWRMDIGSVAGGMDRIQVNNFDSVVVAGHTVFDSTGAALGTFALSQDNSDATGLAGLGVVGLGGADVAGFDMSSYQIFWEVALVPAPGALALLGLAGLVGVSRRRRD